MLEPKLGDTVSVMFDGRVIAVSLDHLNRPLYHVQTPSGFTVPVTTEHIMFGKKETSNGT